MNLLPPITQSDLDMAVFLATRNPRKLRFERPSTSVQRMAEVEYDRVTEHNLRFIRGEERRIA